MSDGYAARIGAELAVNQTNAAGGVDGRTIDLVVLDDTTDPRSRRRRPRPSTSRTECWR